MDRRLGVSHKACRLGDTFPTDGLVRIDFNSSVQLIWSVAQTVGLLLLHLHSTKSSVASNKLEESMDYVQHFLKL